MGDGVVHVEQVELVPLGDLGYFGGQSHGVGRVLEQVVVLENDGVIKEVGAVFFPQSKGHIVADEVHLVSSVSEPDAELGGQSTAAPNGGVADDANF